jgi:hypothetical protein
MGVGGEKVSEDAVHRILSQRVVLLSHEIESHQADASRLDQAALEHRRKATLKLVEQKNLEGFMLEHGMEVGGPAMSPPTEAPDHGDDVWAGATDAFDRGIKSVAGKSFEEKKAEVDKTMTKLREATKDGPPLVKMGVSLFGKMVDAFVEDMGKKETARD